MSAYYTQILHFRQRGEILLSKRDIMQELSTSYNDVPKYCVTMMKKQVRYYSIGILIQTESVSMSAKITHL